MLRITMDMEYRLLPLPFNDTNWRPIFEVFNKKDSIGDYVFQSMKTSVYKFTVNLPL